MGFSKGSFCRVFKVEDKGNYHVAQISISKKNKQTGEYETEFQDGRVRLVGTAHEQAKKMNVGDKGISLKIGSCDVTNKYDKEKKVTYVNYVIFGFEDADGNSNGGGQKKDNGKINDGFVSVQNDMEELPFA